MSSAIQTLITRLGLEPHPEGGHYSESYRSPARVTSDDGSTLHASTAIYYMLHAGAWSAWHRIQSDEVWHFYCGTALNIYVLGDTAGLITYQLGNPLETPNANFQAVVPAGRWFAAELCQFGGYALVGCTVAPGFEFSHFELADTETLLQQYPQHKALISRLGSKRTPK